MDILIKMMDCVVDTGKIITFEPHWISSSSNFHLHGHDQSRFIQLGLLQKLYEQDAARSGKDGNIGMKIPIYLSQLGLKDIECRVSDKVNFLHPHMEINSKKGCIPVCLRAVMRMFLMRIGISLLTNSLNVEPLLVKLRFSMRMNFFFRRNLILNRIVTAEA